MFAGGKRKAPETPSVVDTDSQESHATKRRGRPKKEDLADISEVMSTNSREKLRFLSSMFIFVIFVLH